jgi:hypothetical protein
MNSALSSMVVTAVFFIVTVVLGFRLERSPSLPSRFAIFPHCAVFAALNIAVLKFMKGSNLNAGMKLTILFGLLAISATQSSLAQKEAEKGVL